MALDPTLRPPLMAITQDNARWSHLEQVHRLLAAGVTWIQLRMKASDEGSRLETAREAARSCRAANAVLIINDSVDLALESGASGVHLGRTDGDWVEARNRLGEQRILGGTINFPDDAERARSAGCLDYVGVGPWRFTSTKLKLAPVLGPEGIAPLLQVLRPLPAWLIGGVLPADMPRVRALGATGAAVSSGLIQEDVEASVSAYLRSWNSL
ncbi:MAG: thiamine phosphate synthase [Opitutaceae bacterium]|nr:thiamine phosphate synthase [Opitutaceae bacterium]